MNTQIPGITKKDPIAWDFFNPAKSDSSNNHHLLDRTVKAINTFHQQVETLTGAQPDVGPTPTPTA